jgi:hypothetical protein
MKDGVEICVGDKLRGQYGGDPKVQIVDITTKSVRMRWVGFEEGIAKCSVLKVTKDFEMDMDIFLRSGWH